MAQLISLFLYTTDPIKKTPFRMKGRFSFMLLPWDQNSMVSGVVHNP